MAKEKNIPKPENKTEPKKIITYEDIWNLKTFSIPNAIINDKRQGNNAILSEDEFRKIMLESRIREEAQKRGPRKRTFQYW